MLEPSRPAPPAMLSSAAELLQTPVHACGHPCQPDSKGQILPHYNTRPTAIFCSPCKMRAALPDSRDHPIQWQDSCIYSYIICTLSGESMVRETDASPSD